jgi:acyl carrier protein
LLAEVAGDDGGHASEVSIREQIINLPADEAQTLVETFLMDEVSTILRLDRASVDVERPISQMGFDSLMTLELHLAVESRLRCELSMMSVGGGATLRSIAARVVRGLRQGAGGNEGEGESLQDKMVRHEDVAPAPVLEAGE